MTLTIQVQPAGACTTSVCAPRLDCDVTDCPDAPVSLIAGVPGEDEPAGVTETWNEGPAAGAGEHLNAQPMFHDAAVVVKAGLVQLPWSCGDVTRTRAGPAGADDPDAVAGDVEPPPAAAVVVVVDPPPGAVLEVAESPGAVVVVLPPVEEPADASLGGGSFPLVDPPAPLALEAPPPVSPLIHMPRTSAIRRPVRSCQFFQVRCCLSLSSPGCGIPSSDANVPSGMVTSRSRLIPH